MIHSKKLIQCHIRHFKIWTKCF